MWTYDVNIKRVVQRDVRYVPGFLKIIDEILVNAADNKVQRVVLYAAIWSKQLQINDPSMDTMKVNIDVEENTISVYNNGRGIPIEYILKRIFIFLNSFSATFYLHPIMTTMKRSSPVVVMVMAPNSLTYIRENSQWKLPIRIPDRNIDKHGRIT